MQTTNDCTLCGYPVLQDKFCNTCKDRMWCMLQQNTELFFDGYTDLDNMMRIADRDLLVILFRINTCPGAPLYLDLVNHDFASEVFQDGDSWYLTSYMDIANKSSELWKHVKK